MWQVWEQQAPSLQDYIHIEVVEAIQPASLQLVRSNVVCFSTALLTTDGGYSCYGGMV